MSLTKKRIVVCCDGTWQNSDNGYVKPSSRKPVPSLQIPSNVTRISRAFARACGDGTFQIIYYQSGVGSRTGIVDKITGGAFGIGIAENIREAYSYICANYVDGDEIVLIGFSRGAFTARSIAGLISNLGLLTREGMEYFYPIFKDTQNWRADHYKDQFPELPFPNKPKGTNAADIYRERLVEKKYSRVRQQGGIGELIRVKAIGVWDTVGSLGIPSIELLSKLGISRDTHEFSWYDTNLSPQIEHAFHALAIDETRGPFSPAVWERLPEQKTTDLRQVWFPGSHANIGGGWADQGVANITLAWMMDQLSSVNVEFIPGVLERLFEQNVEYYKSLQPKKMNKIISVKTKPRFWAAKHIHIANEPIRPWALHKISSANSVLYNLAGRVPRSPGLYKKIDAKTGRTTKAFLEDTNERIHSSVRVRLACQGLSINDEEVWKCEPLLRLWRPRRVPVQFYDPVPPNATWGPVDRFEPAANGAGPSTAGEKELRWVWDYIGPEKHAPMNRTIVEENLGPFEKRLLNLAAGKDHHVFEYADEEDFAKFKFPDG
ncbi:hypothetical protein BJ170DRAFT_701492 [Xylariales sp. AK1849]|nr:hypothetical protein BJ170DRAFT_701492 [Xylariales sp. AK1849]